MPQECKIESTGHILAFKTVKLQHLQNEIEKNILFPFNLVVVIQAFKKGVESGSVLSLCDIQHTHNNNNKKKKHN